MPRSRVTVALTADYVEMVHDEMVAIYWSLDEPINPSEFRDIRLIESAVNRPLQSAFGRSIHRTVVEKAAALFHSLITNHPFANGNKRTAVIAVDLFLIANGYDLYLSQEEMYRLAKETAQHNELSISPDAMLSRIKRAFRANCIPFRSICGDAGMERMQTHLKKMRDTIRKSLLGKAAVDQPQLSKARRRS